jgi:class 3 adenylate cyclase
MDNESVNSGDSQNVAERSNENKDVEEERATLARKEAMMVFRLKIGVFVVLAFAFVFTSMFVAKYIEEDQRQNFELAFAADAGKVIEAFHKEMERQIEAVDALGVAITSHAESSGEVFPNVTLPHFGVQFSNGRALSGSFVVGYYAYVTDETRTGWEAYEKDHRSHADDALTLEVYLRKTQDARYNLNTTAVDPIPITSDVIFAFGDDNALVPRPPGSGPYLPLWQLSPTPPDKILLNYDALSKPSEREAYMTVITSGQAVIDTATNVNREVDEDTNEVFSILLKWSQYRGDVRDYEADPSSNFLYPVFDSFDVDNRQVVGVLATSVYWRLFFKDILADSARGIICVLENTRNQTFTYRIDDKVTYLGNGDRHEAKFNHMEQHSENVKAKWSLMETKSFTSVDLNLDYCSYKLRVYPSQDTQNLHVNNDPWWALLVVDAVFIFTVLVFIFYTVAVKRLHQVVMDRAIASGAIVSSLFPSQVREQLYQENEAKKSSATWKNDGDNPDGALSSRPIANMFDTTTIMFADMVGFTKWSSTREPVQVFELLETLYQAFDTIAERRKVFKVETIGDCYVAVAGLPEPQENHAVIMAKFADDCMVKMGQLTAELATVLGEDTAGLAMRVGLHSGSVTGGVLRGQKSRFQLFGDTMNTASRMESNGMPHRMHVSQETADELMAKGKSGWVTPREDKIVAKGKGELQTYWVTIRCGSQSVVSRKTSNNGGDENFSGKGDGNAYLEL